MSALWFVVAGFVFSAFLFLHAPITVFCDAVIQRVGFPTYERIALGSAVLAALATAAALRRHRSEAGAVTWPFLLTLAGLVALAQPALVLINIENIHFAQYALLAMLLCRAGLAPESAWLATTALGLVDEAYQFLFLRFGRPDRLDWNDIAFNAIGAAFGVAIVLHLTRERPRAHRHSWRAIVAVLALPVVAALALVPPVFSPFYSITPHGLRSHELTAGEGLILVGLLWVAINELVWRVARCTSMPRARRWLAGVA